MVLQLYICECAEVAKSNNIPAALVVTADILRFINGNFICMMSRCQSAKSAPVTTKLLPLLQGAAQAVPEGLQVGVIQRNSFDRFFVYGHRLLEPYLNFLKLRQLRAIAGQIVCE